MVVVGMKEEQLFVRVLEKDERLKKMKWRRILVLELK